MEISWQVDGTRVYTQSDVPETRDGGSPAASFDLHHNAAIRYTSEPVSTNAAMALFDAQKRLLLEKIWALEVV